MYRTRGDIMIKHMMVTDIYNLIDNIVKTQDILTNEWHTDITKGINNQGVVSQDIVNNHLMNFKIWHAEDIARQTDVPDSVIANCKHDIDVLNQRRTVYYEAIDEYFMSLLQDVVINDSNVPYNTESVGSIIDRLSILSLKIYHMQEEKRRRTVEDSEYESVSNKLELLLRQKQDLVMAFKHLIQEYFDGNKRPLSYKQFKMYNNKSLNPMLYKQQD